MQDLVESIDLKTQASFYTFAVRIVADKEIFGNTEDFARKLGITVISSRSEGFGFHLDGYVGEVVAIMTNDEIKEKLASKVEQKTVCYYSQNETAINRENDKVKERLFALKAEYENGSSTFSFTIGEVYCTQRQEKSAKHGATWKILVPTVILAVVVPAALGVAINYLYWRPRYQTK